MLKCIIVDDEQFSVDALSRYIEMMPGIEISSVFLDSIGALASISALGSNDLLFLDIDMPDLSGLELAQALRPKFEKIIFTTAHSKYAFEAYEATGDAYLLKPFSFAKFSTTVNRLFNDKREPNNADQNKDDYFLVKSKADDLAIVKIKYRDVIAFESAQNYVKIYLNAGEEVTAYLTLKDILQLVKHKPEFIQLHRSFIISTENIKSIKDNQVLMTNKLSISVGEIYKGTFNNYVNGKLMVTLRKQE